MDVSRFDRLGSILYLSILLEVTELANISKICTLIAFFGAVSLFPFYIIEELICSKNYI